MSTDETTIEDEATESDAPAKLTLDVKIDAPSACERHMTVTISREDIDRYFDEAYSEMMPKASIPGFRSGRAPRKLVEQRFKKDISDQVKGSLLVDSMAQVSEDSKLTPISEPEFDLGAVTIPEKGPLTYEFKLEVRPDFELPKWEGLEVERSVRSISDKDVDKRLAQLLARFGGIVPHAGAAEPDDYLVLRITSRHEGRQLASSSEQTVRLRPVLSLQDCRVENFGQLMAGAKEGETRSTGVEISADSAQEDLRGKQVELDFEVLDVKRLKLPELDADFFAAHGGEYADEADLRAAVRSELERQIEYHQQQQARRQVTKVLTEAANWELPPTLLRRQSRRELERAVLELRRNGFSEEEIRARENFLRQNSGATTARALKEHFILERIAEDQSIDATDEDYDLEMRLIALQSNESLRRVRAKLEKSGQMDALRNQIIERKVLHLILSKAKFKDVPVQEEEDNVSALDLAAGGGEPELPPAPEGQAAVAGATGETSGRTW